MAKRRQVPWLALSQKAGRHRACGDSAGVWRHSTTTSSHIVGLCTMFQTSEARLRQILLILLIALAGFFSLSIFWRELQAFSSIIFLFFAAWLISFVLSPVAGWLQQLRLS